MAIRTILGTWTTGYSDILGSRTWMRAIEIWSKCRLNCPMASHNEAIFSWNRSKIDNSLSNNRNTHIPSRHSLSTFETRRGNIVGARHFEGLAVDWSQAVGWALLSLASAFSAKVARNELEVREKCSNHKHQHKTARATRSSRSTFSRLPRWSESSSSKLQALLLLYLISVNSIQTTHTVWTN